MVPPAPPHGYQSGPEAGRISWSGTGGSGGGCTGTRAWSPSDTRTDVVTQITDPPNHSISIKISLPAPYLKHPKPILNTYGLPNKQFYTTADVCKILKINPDTLRKRIYAGYYPEPDRLGDKRRFTLKDIKNILNVTSKLRRNGKIKVGKSQQLSHQTRIK